MQGRPPGPRRRSSGRGAPSRRVRRPKQRKGVPPPPSRAHRASRPRRRAPRFLATPPGAATPIPRSHKLARGGRTRAGRRESVMLPLQALRWRSFGNSGAWRACLASACMRSRRRAPPSETTWRHRPRTTRLRTNERLRQNRGLHQSTSSRPSGTPGCVVARASD